MSEIGLAWPFSTSFAQENDKDGLSAWEELPFLRARMEKAVHRRRRTLPK